MTIQSGSFLRCRVIAVALELLLSLSVHLEMKNANQRKLGNWPGRLRVDEITWIILNDPDRVLVFQQRLNKRGGRTSFTRFQCNGGCCVQESKWLSVLTFWALDKKYQRHPSFRFTRAGKPLCGEGESPATVDTHGVNWGQRLDQHSFLFVFLEWSQSNIVLIFICNEPNFWTELCNNKHRKGKLEGRVSTLASAFLHDNENNKTENFSALLVKFTLPFFPGPFLQLCWASPHPSPRWQPWLSRSLPTQAQLPSPSAKCILLEFTSQSLGRTLMEALCSMLQALHRVCYFHHSAHPSVLELWLDGSSPWKWKVIGLGLDLSRWRQWDCVGASQRWMPCWCPEKF